MRFKIIGLIIALFLISSTAAFALKQERLHFSKARVIDEYTHPGEEMTVVVNIENDDTINMKKMKVTVLIPELAVRKRLGPFELKPGKEKTKQVLLELPRDTQPGWYAVRITLSDDDHKRVKFRHVFIGPRIIYI